MPDARHPSPPIWTRKSPVSSRQGTFVETEGDVTGLAPNPLSRRTDPRSREPGGGRMPGARHPRPDRHARTSSLTETGDARRDRGRRHRSRADSPVSAHRSPVSRTRGGRMPGTTGAHEPLTRRDRGCPSKPRATPSVSRRTPCLGTQIPGLANPGPCGCQAPGIPIPTGARPRSLAETGDFRRDRGRRHRSRREPPVSARRSPVSHTQGRVDARHPASPSRPARRSPDSGVTDGRRSACRDRRRRARERVNAGCGRVCRASSPAAGRGESDPWPVASHRGARS